MESPTMPRGSAHRRCIDVLLPIVLCSCLIALCSTMAHAKRHSPEVTEVKKRYAECTKVVRSKETKGIKLVRLWDRDKDDLGKWQLRGKGVDRSAIMVSATVFVHDDRIRSSEIYETSPSGDSSLTTSYCFRVDGSLAFLLSKLRTANFYHPKTSAGGVVLVQTRKYFDPKGTEVRKLVKAHLAATKQKVTTGWQEVDARVYLTSKKMRQAFKCCRL